MNQLNSILIEGTLTKDPKVTGSERFVLGSCHFPIETKGTDSKTGIRKAEISSFTVEAWGKNAEKISVLKAGRSVRVVGRIKSRQSDDHEDLPDLFIIAEHIEIKPKLKDMKD